MKSNNIKLITYAVILFVVYMWWKNRPNLSNRCASVWNATCTECRQIFFEINSDIDNNDSLLATIQQGADADGKTLWNAKVHYIASEMKASGKIDEAQRIEIETCMSENEASLRIVK